jgi:NAD(P)-dependent dehydrogenase (short-subunit alcohol dehydrogenase family)
VAEFTYSCDRLDDHVQVSIMSNKRKVWFITGVSRGLGKSIAEQAIARGDVVIGTTRDGKSDIKASPDVFKVVVMDVTDEARVYRAVEQAQEFQGRIDVVVNNAGYGLLGAVEEVSTSEAKTQFETNFFGMLNVIQAVLPLLRSQRSGHIMNISSVAGMTGLPGCGLYAASKFAMEGLSESLSHEIAPFGIRVTIVEPGAFRTDFLSQQSIKVSDYASDRYPQIQTAVQNWNNMNGAQAGDPVKAAKAIVDAATLENPPLRLVLGPDAFERIKSKITLVSDELARYSQVSLGTNYVGS